jgi:hypothetical protein
MACGERRDQRASRLDNNIRRIGSSSEDSGLAPTTLTPVAGRACLVSFVASSHIWGAQNEHCPLEICHARLDALCELMEPLIFHYFNEF